MPDYLLTVTTNRNQDQTLPVTTERLVRAKNEARAIAHVVKDTIAIDRASTDEIIRLTQAGVKIEVAA